MIALLLIALSPQRAAADKLEKLLMPGKLSQAHAKYEEQCSTCHDRKDRARQDRLCLDCHKDVAADMGKHQGFHGRLSNIERSKCVACHSEHGGREADIVKLDREAFAHRGTDFALAGAHAGVPCDACHVPGKKFREAPADCASCHRREEPHRGQLGRNCAGCHSAESWSKVQFDHGKTVFALTGRHAELACTQCHFGERYKQTPKECVSCHAPDDVHDGERGVQCGQCHATREWRAAKFDHTKATGFALEGAHARIACGDCHRSGRLQDPLPRECFGCHRGQDAHAGRFADDCQRCHANERWQSATFDHERDGHWPLAGKHAQVACHACHTAALAAQRLTGDCNGCHRASDVHTGQLGTDCAQCHNPDGWRKNIQFDHDLTAFPLVGLHVAVPCVQCHSTRSYKDTESNCYACHRDSDAHKGGLGKECAQCHSPAGWDLWEFDHGRTGFALTGAHAALACAGCHKQPATEVKLDTSCQSCHAQDDVHLGQFGRQCNRCHSTATFKGAKVH